MKKYFRYLFVVFILVFGDSAFCGSFRISVEGWYHIPAGGILPDEQNLQSAPSTNGQKAYLSYLFGKDYGILLGASYANEDTEYIQTTNSKAYSKIGRFVKALN